MLYGPKINLCCNTLTKELQKAFAYDTNEHIKIYYVNPRGDLRSQETKHK